MTAPIPPICEKLRAPTDAEGIYDHIINLRKQTKSDLPRLSLVCEIECIDEERAEAAETIIALVSALERIARGQYDGMEVSHFSARVAREIARTALAKIMEQGRG